MCMKDFAAGGIPLLTFVLFFWSGLQNYQSDIFYVYTIILHKSTPAREQNYIVCELQQKISVLYSFLEILKKKSIVFSQL